MSEWFDRVVLMSNENDKQELGKGTHVYTAEDKELLKKYQNIIKKENSKASPDIRIIDEANAQIEALKNKILTYNGMANMMI